MVNRKLVRPNLAQLKERFTPPPPRSAGSERSERSERTERTEPATREPQANGTSRRRPAPPEITCAEAFYYLKQMNNQTPMVVVLDDGEKLRGHIEWYDRSCLKVNRVGAPNLLIYKHTIKYLYKQDEEEKS